MKSVHIICVLILIILALLIGSCQDEVIIGDIDDDLYPFVESFIEAAAERDMVFDIDNLPISITISNIPNTNIQGQCSSLSIMEDRHVTIDNSYWRSLKDDFYGREFLVYHELGHCLLIRVHSNVTDNQGNCISVMAAGDAGCVNTYGPDTREEFLDELFK